MPEKETLKRARRDKRQGKSPSSQAGEYVREEIRHIREGKHGAESAKQAMAIGLSKARRGGVDLPPPPKGQAPARTRKRAARDYARGHGAPPRRKATAKRSRATLRALRRKGRSAAFREALSRHAHRVAARRTGAQRSASARKAARTMGPARRKTAARKAARTRKGRARRLPSPK